MRLAFCLGFRGNALCFSYFNIFWVSFFPLISTKERRKVAIICFIRVVFLSVVGGSKDALPRGVKKGEGLFVHSFFVFL